MNATRSSFSLSLSLLAALAALSTACSGTDDGNDGNDADEGALAVTTGDSNAPVRSVLYGTIRRGGRPAAGLALRIGCPTIDAELGGDARTDESGSYTIAVYSRAYGKCAARVSDGPLSGPLFDVGVSRAPLRLDLDFDAKLAPTR